MWILISILFSVVIVLVLVNLRMWVHANPVANKTKLIHGVGWLGCVVFGFQISLILVQYLPPVAHVLAQAILGGWRNPQLPQQEIGPLNFWVAAPGLTACSYNGGVAGTLLCETAACTTPSGVTAACWDLDILVQTRSNGSSGTIMANGVARVHAAVAGTVASATGEGLVTPMTNGGVITPAVATCDLTADTALSLTVTWSASSSSNTLTGLNYIIESLN